MIDTEPRDEHKSVGHIYRVKTNSIAIGSQNWPKGSLISGDRLGPLLPYFKSLHMVEDLAIGRRDDKRQPVLERAS